MACTDCDNNCGGCTCASNTVIYKGSALECLGVNNGDNLETVLDKIEGFICSLTGSQEFCSDCILYCGNGVTCNDEDLLVNNTPLTTILEDIYNRICSIGIPQDGADGADGISIEWLGSLASAPLSPTLNQAYYNTTDGISYIWDGASWQIVAQDGADGADGVGGMTFETLLDIEPFYEAIATESLIPGATHTISSTGIFQINLTGQISKTGNQGGSVEDAELRLYVNNVLVATRKLAYATFADATIQVLHPTIFWRGAINATEDVEVRVIEGAAPASRIIVTGVNMLINKEA